MSKRRLHRLEGSLPPKQAVLHWLGEAHAAGSLPAYVASLIDQPEAAQPFVAIPRRVQDAVWQRMRGEPRSAIKTAMDGAVGDTVFLLRLVLGLNVHVEEVLRVESLRHAALLWWSRALEPNRRAAAQLPLEWHAGAAMLVATVAGTEEARRAAEARYLDGRDVLFPQLATAWEDLCGAVADIAGGDAEVMAMAAQDVERVARMARADGLDAVGRHGAANEMADRVAATSMGEGADG